MAKFDWIPYIQGKYLTYYEWFAVLGSLGLSLLSFLSFVVYLGLNKIKNDKKQYEKQVHRSKSMLDRFKDLFFNLSFIFISMIPLICAGLDVTYFVVGVAGMAGVLVALMIVNNGRQKWELEMKNMYTRSALDAFMTLALKIDKKTKKQIWIAVLISVLANLFMYRSCLCFYNDDIGYYNPQLGFGVNTYATRLISLKKSCPPGPPCQMYTTVPENPEEAFFLNVHTHIDVKNVVVFYKQFNSVNGTFKNVTADSFKYDGLESLTERMVHSALIYGLKPNTRYITKVFYDGQYWTNAIYKTLPSDPSTPIRMINLGDSGYTKAAVNLSKIVATLNPDIFFVGGDIAYDDNMPACSYVWDSFLGMYGQITATLGYMMPILVTVGNHDAGLNQLPGINITVDNRGPAFLIYFPQHYDRNSKFQIIKSVPPVNRRRTVMDFTFSNVHYLLLDSGYLHGFDGWQKNYMIDAFQRNRDKIKFVNYHVPIYSVCQAFDKNPQRFLYALFHWVPNFDKYKVMTVFQNHVHSFKRTKPLIGSTPSDKGTVYVGDGNYGAVSAQHCTPDASMPIFQKFLKVNNFWISQIRADRVNHIAYDSYGAIVDQFTQYAADYKLNDVQQIISQNGQTKKIREEKKIEQL